MTVRCYRLENAKNSLTKGIGKGIFHLHKKGILHRDLKSLNVLLDGQMRAMVCDFGISRVKQETRTTTTSQDTAQSVGTIPWMAPELFDGATYTTHCDVYSFGMVLWEIASRKNPWTDAANSRIIMRWVCDKGKREKIPGKTPPSYAKLITDCWKERAKERLTMDEALEMLKENKAEALSI